MSGLLSGGPDFIIEAICIVLISYFFFYKSLRNWRWGVGSVAVWFVIVDLIRKVMGGTKALLIVSDFLVLFVFCVFWLQYGFCGRRRLWRYIPKVIRLLLVGFVCIILLEALNPLIPDPILRIAGVRTYLFYIATLGLGLFFLRSEKDLDKIYIFLLFVSLPLVLLSFYQLISDPATLGVAMTSMGSPVHSYGSYNFDLISATFASSKRFGRFLFLVYPFVYGIGVYRNKPKFLRFGVFLLFMTAAVISGSREIVVLILLFHAMFWVLASSKKREMCVKVFVLLAFLMGLWITIMNFNPASITKENYRIKAVLSSQNEWEDRFKMYIEDAISKPFKKYGGLELLLGTGVGTYGQETLLIGDQDYTRSLGINRMAGDAGITKLLVELGVIGLLYFMVMYCIILKTLWRRIYQFKKSKIYSLVTAVYFIPVGWLILFLKAHTVISDGMMSFGLWFSIGFILAFTYYGKTGFFPVSFRCKMTDNGDEIDHNRVIKNTQLMEVIRKVFLNGMRLK